MSSIRPSACSGLMYAGVPNAAPGIVRAEFSSSWRTWIERARSRPRTSSLPRTLATPQSSTTVSPNSPIITLSGLMSRWITPRLCA